MVPQARLLLSAFTLTVCLSLPATTSSTAAEPSALDENYARADLPPLLEFLDGTPVRNLDDWARRKAEIRRLLCKYFIGTFPTSVPAILDARVLEENKHDDGSLRRRVELTFDTPNRAAMEIRMWVPPGAGPFPILLTAPRFYQREWARVALDRGYLVCLFPGLISQQEQDYPGYDTVWKTFRAEYPQATWTEIAAKAWLASRALDYVLDPRFDYPVVRDQVAITGFSRYGKLSLIAAAFDERIAAVVDRSSGAPGSCPYRFTSRNTFTEAPADFPPEWFLPSLRSYTGREHQLPIDAHGWLALIAPRRCLIDCAHNDDGGSTFAVERAYLEGRSVYQLLGHPENLCIDYRAGGHEPVTEQRRQRNIDWFDLAFGRGSARQSDFPEEFLHRFDWQEWKSRQTKAQLKIPFSTARVSADRVDRTARIRWALGEAPAQIGVDVQRAPLGDAGPGRVPVSFGDNIHGDVYFNAEITTPAPAVIWLHPYSYATGYGEAYGVQGAPVYHRLAGEGLVVLAYDQCGFGRRLLEGRDFYDGQNYPAWSRLGRMVHDVRCAVDFLVDGKGHTSGSLPPIRPDQVYLLGYSLGGMVGLYSAALDERIAGVASFCGFTPLRSDTDAGTTGGIRRLWEWHALQPRLGLFDGRERQIPYDFEDVLALIAPRPCLIVSPTGDRDADVESVIRSVAKSREAWDQLGNPDALTHLTPDDVNRFQQDQQAMFLQWCETIRGDRE